MDIYFNIKNIILTLYIVIATFLKLDLNYILPLIIIDMLSYSITHYKLKLQKFDNVMAIHHIVTISQCLFYYIYKNDKITEITYLILEVEISTLFLLFEMSKFLNGYLKIINKILFITTFVYYRIYKYYFILKQYLLYLNYIDSIFAISILSLYLLSIYWLHIIIRKIFKFIDTKQNFINSEFILKYTQIINIFIIIYNIKHNNLIYYFLINKIYLYDNIYYLIYLFLIGQIYLSYNSYYLHHNIYNYLKNNDILDVFNIKIKDSYIKDLKSIILIPCIITIILSIKNKFYIWGIISLILQYLINFLIDHFDLAKNKLLVRLPMIIEFFIIGYINEFDYYTMHLYLITYIILLSFIIKPFYNSTMVFIHILTFFGSYYICNIINK